MEPRPARVLVAADSDVAIARLEAGLRADPSWHVLTGSLGALGRLIEEHDPEVIVLASERAIATLVAIGDAMPLPPAVLLVEDPRAAWTPAARRSGVRAVLPRRAATHEISAALAAVRAGLVALHPHVFRSPDRAMVLGADAERALTARELEILVMLAEGVSNRTVARRLGISSYTVKFHVASILAKLGAGSRTEAVTVGLRRGLIAL